MQYDNIEQFPDTLWDDFMWVEGKGKIQRMTNAQSESLYYCDHCGAVVEDYDDEHECEG